MRTRWLAVVAAAGLLVASCGDDDGGTSAEAGADSPTTTAAAAGGSAGGTAGGATGGAAAEAGTDADLRLGTTGLGDVLVDADGMTLYLFVPDDRGDSTCYDQCATNWPPVGEVSGVGDGLDPSLLGTTTRTDGSVQATYGGWPLYRFARDAGAGDTTGQGVNDVWWVLDATGEAVRPAAAPAPAAAPGY